MPGSCFLPQVRAVASLRIAHVRTRLHLLPWALHLRACNLSQTSADIHPLATIGPGLLSGSHLRRGDRTGAVTGSNCRMHQGATLGEPGLGNRNSMSNPVVGNSATAPSIVGDGALIGANSVVVSDIPADSVAGEIPARSSARLTVRARIGLRRSTSPRAIGPRVLDPPVRLIEHPRKRSAGPGRSHRLVLAPERSPDHFGNFQRGCSRRTGDVEVLLARERLLDANDFPQSDRCYKCRPRIYLPSPRIWSGSCALTSFWINSSGTRS